MFKSLNDTMCRHTLENHINNTTENNSLPMIIFQKEYAKWKTIDYEWTTPSDVLRIRVFILTFLTTPSTTNTWPTLN